MTLFSLSTRNIKKNFRNYLVYFISIVFNVMIYFTFISIRYNQQIGDFLEENSVILYSFNGASAVLAIFSVIFIGYSTTFFMKKRKKEMGLYSLLGLKKSQIGFMVFYENIMMGLLAVLVGIIMGSVLCKFYIMILFKLMEMSLGVAFSFNTEAVLSTFKVFGLLFLVTSLYGYGIIYRFKLIELFKADKVVEKSSKPNKFLGILSMIIIIVGYVVGLQTQDNSASFTTNIPITLAFTILGTYLFFGSFLNLVCSMIQSKESFYYKGTRIIEVSNFIYRIKSNSKTLATIVILSATTITSIGSVFSFYTSIDRMFKVITPFSYSYSSTSQEIDKQIEDIISKYPKNKLVNKHDLELIQTTGNLEGLKIDDSDKNFYIISQGEANKILRYKGINEKISLKSDNEVVFMRYIKGSKEKFDNPKVSFDLDKNREFEVVKKLNYPAMDGYRLENTFVVSNGVYDKYATKNKVVRSVGYQVENQTSSKELTRDIIRALPIESNLVSAYENVNVQIFVSFILFVGLFIGLVFLISTGSIIYFKQLTDANESKERYKILKKIGVSDNEIKSSVYKQVLVIFAIPLVLGIIHSIVALTILSNIVINENITLSVTIIILAYTLIYFVYYLLTARSYNKIVNSNL